MGRFISQLHNISAEAGCQRS